MKLSLSSPLALSLLALAALSSAADAPKPYVRCNVWKKGIPFTQHFVLPLWLRYSVEAHDIPEGEDVPALCNKLWKELKQFAGSCVVNIDRPHCKANGPTKLQWDFSVGLGCNTGMVQAAWWDAVKDRMGLIKCVDVT
ncbi:uncharacterized protein CTRU02_212770 [Colletotrichum truncatum]|uniref:Uncharacterized protein n=1 Tax=Colletotrichum truncatum TaxID=5467 RepID=A0ACC3YKU8_COLTU|nr:uncharacterized protein CTRU02_05151 [Colletotrichum truncatum]KAF6794319.1 hypothetical protein CTRU02_05151 [Colletotrichum truncatum]